MEEHESATTAWRPTADANGKPTLSGKVMNEGDLCVRLGAAIHMAGLVAGRALTATMIATVLGAAANNPYVDRGLLDFQQGRPAEAFQDWQQAASAGDPRGAFYIGILYDTGRGVPQDYQHAMAWYRRAAELGSTDGAFNVGVFYDAGLGVSPNSQQAASWYARAAAGGSGRAEYNLAMMYETGAGVPLDHVRAMAFYRSAADQGMMAARAHLASFQIRVAATSRKADDPATQDFLQAQHVLLSRGPADATRMTILMRRSADQHNPLAEYDLGYCYEHAMGVSHDLAQAVVWYRRAASDATDEALRAIAQSSIQNLEGHGGDHQTPRPARFVTAAADGRPGR